MRVIVDGDACPVLEIIEEICKEEGIELIVVSDTNHVLYLEYGKHLIVDKARDSADYVIVNLLEKDDIVVSQDYGLASMALLRKVKIIHPKGFMINDLNIEELLFSRYISSKIRHSTKKKHLSGPSKRTKEDNEHFIEVLYKAIGKEW